MVLLGVTGVSRPGMDLGSSGPLGHLSFGGSTQGVTYLAICLKSVNVCLSYV